MNNGALSWNDQGANTYYIRALDSAGNSTYLGQTSSLSFNVSGNAEEYLVRHWINGQSFDAICPGGGPGFNCSLNNGVLTWNDQGVSTYYIRALDGAGGSTYLGSSTSLSFTVSGNDPGYLVRYWVSGQSFDTVC